MPTNTKTFYQKLKGKLMSDQPKLLDPAAFQGWQTEYLAALVTALGGDRRKLYLSFLATVPQAELDEWQVCRPEPYRGNGPPPKPIKVKTKAELFAIARQAAKQGKRPEQIYEHWVRDRARRLTQDERNEIAAIVEAPRKAREGKAEQEQAKVMFRMAQEQQDRERRQRDQRLASLPSYE